MTLGQHLFLRPGCRQPHDGCAAGEMRTEHLHRATVEFGERLAFKGAGTFKRTMRGAIPGLAWGSGGTAGLTGLGRNGHGSLERARVAATRGAPPAERWPLQEDNHPALYVYIYICQPQTIKASNKNPPSLTKGSGEGHPNKTTTFRQEPGQPNKRPYPSRASEGRMSSLGGPSQKSRTRCSNHHSFQPGWWEKKKMYGTQSVAESTVLSEPTNKSRKCLHHFGVTGLK